MGNLQNLTDLLLYDQDRNVVVLRDLLDAAERVGHKGWREAQRWFVEQQQTGLEQDRVGQGEHLLLTTGECPGPLAKAILESRKQRENVLDSLLQCPSIAKRHTAHLQVFPNREIAEDFVPLRHIGHARRKRPQRP